MSQVSRGSWLNVLVLGLCLVFVFSCSQENGLLGPGTSNNQGAGIGKQAPTFLTWKASSLAKEAGTSAGYAEAVITVAAGGSVAVSGVRVDVPAGALREDQTISVTTHESAEVKADFGPAYQFELPVTVSVDLEAVDMASHDPNSITFYWYNETTQLWETVASQVNGMVISAAVDHFSIYGVGDGPRN